MLNLQAILSLENLKSQSTYILIRQTLGGLILYFALWSVNKILASNFQKSCPLRLPAFFKLFEVRVVYYGLSNRRSSAQAVEMFGFPFKFVRVHSINGIYNLDAAPVRFNYVPVCYHNSGALTGLSGVFRRGRRKERRLKSKAG